MNRRSGPALAGLIAPTLVAMALLLAPAARAALPFKDVGFKATTSVGVGTGSFDGAFAVDTGIIVGITGSGGRIGDITSLSALGFIALAPECPPNDDAYSPTAPFLTTAGVTFAAANVSVVDLHHDGPGHPA